MTAYSVDFSYARPSPDAIKAAGYSAVWRYLSGGTPGKDITFDEFETYLHAGLGVGLVWETTAQAALQGAGQGVTDGRTAAFQATSVGYPAGAVLVANVGDFAATPDQIPAIAAYYNAFAAETAKFQQGGYATGWIIDELVDAGCKGIWWQNAENDSGQLGSTLSVHASVYQDVIETLPQIAGSGRADYDQDVNIGPIVWALTDPPPTAPTIPIREETPMFVAVAVGTAASSVTPGAQFLLFSNGTKYVIQSLSDSASLQAKLGPLVQLSCGFLNNMPNQA